jgi:predicted metalloprotease with PDZ domain
MMLDFVTDQQRLGLNTRLWIPKFPHPFIPNLVAAATKDRWACAEGFKWVSQDPKSNDCIEQNVGLVGLTLATQSPSTFPQIATIAPGGSAEQAGIAVGTFIITIDGVSAEGLSVSSLISKIRGQVGTTIRLGIVTTGGAPRVVTLTRR